MNTRTTRRLGVLAAVAGGACLLQAGCASSVGYVTPLFFDLIVSNFVTAAVGQIANSFFTNVIAVI